MTQQPAMAQSTRSSDEVHHLAVYGTLRDDDDSGALWTRAFLEGLVSARDGHVDGAAMFWSSEGLWPFAVLHPTSPALAESEELAEQQAAAHAAATEAGSATAAVPGPSICAAPCDLQSRIRVRLLSWGPAGNAAFASKLAEADRIEGYDPAHEAASEYVRRKVWVRLSPQRTPTADEPGAATVAAGAAPLMPQPASQTPSPPESRRVAAWLYVKQAGMREVGASNERMEDGDWMLRDRSRKSPQP